MRSDSDVTSSLHACNPMPSLPGSFSHLFAALKALPDCSTSDASLCFPAAKVSASNSSWPVPFTGRLLLLLLSM